MLRDYRYTKDQRLVWAAFSQFAPCPDNLRLVDFDAITPDSFIWQLYDPARRVAYYLYAEDYVPHLEHVRQTLRSKIPDTAIIDLLPVTAPNAFEDSHPNQTAVIYKPPDSEYDFMRYAAQSGYDFVFLAKSDEWL